MTNVPDVQLGPSDNNETRLCDRYNRQRSEAGQRGQVLYYSIRDVVYLTDMKRQGLVNQPCFSCPLSFHLPGAPCAYFGQFMKRLRFGDCCPDDFLWAKGRHMSQLDSTQQALFEDAFTLWLVPKRSDAHNLNLTRLERFHVKEKARGGLQLSWVCPMRARDRGKIRGPNEDVAGLPPFTVLCRGAPVSLCTNVNLAHRMFNGSVGRVVDCVFPDRCGPQHDGREWPLYIIVDFPDYKGHVFDLDFPTHVPIIPVESSNENGVTREMFPLKLAFCMTCHKAQVTYVHSTPSTPWLMVCVSEFLFILSVCHSGRVHVQR